jgi:hypothetical protein
MELKDCPNCSKHHFDPANCKAIPGAHYVPVEFPQFYCIWHGIELEEVDVQVQYNDETGRTKALTQFQRCPKKEFIFFRCPYTIMQIADEKGKIIRKVETHG